ncbi:hypothetical protein [Pseudomonas sp. 5Ae-yellow]|uniref:hypothetical protein n=1 Tax=Pseudomonas sp. 5Ae-yellow TaxID=2759848 RepID=UPI0015F46FD9|nr:hypothetical protein [Pseudomonas sp. 5Ae-yellow]MBA6420545.1 hypothetical protein [Pseudomonas sp. 5Ae-yellow]
MKINISFLTPLTVFLGVVLLSFIAYPHESLALEGFISTPLYYSSAFITLQLSLLLVSMRSSNVSAPAFTAAAFGILEFTYGIFITIIIAKWYSSKELFELAGLLVFATTALMLTVDAAYSGRWVKIHNLLSLNNNEKARKIGATISWSSTAIFACFCIYLRATM